MSNKWKYWGRNERGEAVFVKRGGEIAVEKDQRYLVDASEEEKKEIFQRWPGLISNPAEDKTGLRAIDGDAIGTLRARITELELLSESKERVCDALKVSHKGREDINLSLMDDLEKAKQRIENLKTINGRWRHEVARKDDIIEALGGGISKKGDSYDG